MEKDIKDKEFEQTQSTSSPGALGEPANRNERDSKKPISKNDDKTSKEDGLNQARAADDSGVFKSPDTPNDV